MTKHLIFTLITATGLAVVGCSSIKETSSDIGSVIPNYLDKTSLIYRPTIQQGNVVTQKMINQLEPGMARKQVSFIMGTPQLIDVFHQSRWDYTYTIGVGSTPDEMRQLSLFFVDDRLSRIEGDTRPEPLFGVKEEKKEMVVTVPDWHGDETGLFDRALRAIGVGEDGKPAQ